MTMIALAIFFGAFACLFASFLPSNVDRYDAFVRHISDLERSRNGPRRTSRERRLHRAWFRFIVLPLVLCITSTSACAICTFKLCENLTPNSPSLPTKPITHPVDPSPGFPTTPPISKEEDLSQPFHLSAVEDSVMLTLDKALIGSASIDADQLAVAADERLGVYIAQFCHPASFFPFYSGLSTFFPDGEDVNYSFDSVSSLDDCNAQLRGAGERLDQYKLTGSPERIGGICHHLAIRSRDALNFAKYKSAEGRSDCLIWLYSELSFAALINEYVYTQPEGLALSNWYYRTAQVFDYLGGIADTEELELRMYFLSAVFLRLSFEALAEQGLQVYPNAYDYEIWTLYMEMLYRVATRMNPARAEGFYLEIQRIETVVLQQPLPDTAIARTTKTLNGLALYQEWREQYG